MIAVDVARFADERLRQADAAGVPPVAEQRRDDVVAGVEQRGDIVRLVLRARMVVGELGREHVVADTLAVDANFVHAQSGSI